MKIYLLRLGLLTFIQLSLQIYTLNAQQLVFNKVAAEEGIEMVKGIAQDKEGYMWFAATGLHRYDGYNFTSYKNDPSNAQSLASDHLESICIDGKGIIWIGTFDSGLDRFDPLTDVFTHFRNNPKDSTSLSNNTCTVIIEDRDGVIWVGTHGGLNKLDQETGKFTRYQHQQHDSTSLSNNQVRALYDDRQGILWVGTGSPFPGDGTPPGHGGLNKLDKKSGTFIRYMHNPKDTNSLIDNKIRAIYEDSKDNFWVGTFGDGLHTMDRAKGTFTRHMYDPHNPEKVSRPYLKRRRTTDGVTFINEDATESIWIGSYEGGLNLYYPTTGLVTHYEGRQQPDSLFDDGPWSIYSSRDGVIWMSTIQGGLYRINPFQKRIPHHTLPEGTVNAFVQEPGNILWIGSVKGLLRYDRNKGTIRRFVNESNNQASLSNNIINTIRKDREGNIWIGTNKGLNMLNRDKQTFTRYSHDPKNSNSLFSDYIVQVYVDSESNLWIGQFNDLDYLNRKTGKFTHYLFEPKDPPQPGIYQDGWERFVVYGMGFHQFDQKISKLKSDLDMNGVLKFYQDTDSVLWVGSINGLYRFDHALDSFVSFVDPGFPKGFKNVWNILEDDHKNLWISASEGIMRINAKRNQTSLYGVKYGIPGFTDIGYFSGYKGQDGELFFGNSTGYYFFFPDQFPRSLQPPQIVINSFWLANQKVKPTKNGPLFQPLSVVDEITLNYDQNVFSFDFAGIDYNNPEENKLFFRLQRYNDDWRQAGAERTAFYFNVPPGNYVFQVKTANSNGLWAEKSIKIIITPPWWRTWWAYSMYSVFFIAIIILTDRIQRKRVIEKERERTRARELAQAKEIEKAYHELSATQVQLIQREKMASLGELTAGIAHEIQNPLNFVNNFSEVNNELIDELKEELQAGNNEQALAIANGIKDNQQKINHHGKRADAIVKGMLQHSRRSEGQKESTDINKLVDEYLRLAYHGIRARDKNFNCGIVTRYDEAIGSINIIPQDIGRVLLNLYNNAFYAVNERHRQTPDGSHYEPTVTVSTRKEGRQFSVSVKDNGNGIPQKIKDKVFNPFFTTKPSGQGTGLGLSLSYDIVKAHGGNINVESKEGEGTDIIVELPFG